MALVTKIHELKKRYNPTVLCLNEVKSSILSSIGLSEYSLVTGNQNNFHDCRSNLFVKNIVKYQIRHD